MSTHPRPYTPGELLGLAAAGLAMDPMRVLATYADPTYWTQIYGGETSPAVDFEAQMCEWAMIGPCRPPQELAIHALGRSVYDPPIVHTDPLTVCKFAVAQIRKGAPKKALPILRAFIVQADCPEIKISGPLT